MVGRLYAKKFGVTFPVAVDTADVFGMAFGLKPIPVTFLVDEVGIIRLHGGGPDASLLREIEALLKEPLTSVRAMQPQLPAAQCSRPLGLGSRSFASRSEGESVVQIETGAGSGTGQLAHPQTDLGD